MFKGEILKGMGVEFRDVPRGQVKSEEWEEIRLEEQLEAENRCKNSSPNSYTTNPLLPAPCHLTHYLISEPCVGSGYPFLLN